MAGIYIHIPFCSKKCNYCDFYSIVPLLLKQDFLEALALEIVQKHNYLNHEIVETVYFGGGTPSLLSVKELERILLDLRQYYTLSDDLELTFEANPENLTEQYLKEIKSIGVNRLSIGIQSFRDSDLVFLKRTHDSKMAYEAVLRAYQLGFENISIDLIYGLPSLSLEDWKQNLKTAFELPINHLSSYHLTYEKDTLLYKRLKEGKVIPLKEDTSILQFEYLMNASEAHGMPYYEISNFAKGDHYSKHNLSYWHQKKYLGLGPSAHSYNGIQRAWNVKNLKKYIEGVNNKMVYVETEDLKALDVENEYLITNLRTKWGVDLRLYQKQFGAESYEALIKNANKYLVNGLMLRQAELLKLTRKGILVSDAILEDLFKI